MGGQQIFENGNGDEGGDEHRDMQGPNAAEAAHDELLASSADLSLSPGACAMTKPLRTKKKSTIRKL
jgi:hypothetical protein